VYENTKETAEELKRIYEERLSQQEEEHESEVRNIVEKNEKVTNKQNKKELKDLIHLLW